MFKRKDLPPILFLVLIIATIMVTLSQILVVHQTNHHGNDKTRDLVKFQRIVREIEKYVGSMTKKDIVPLHIYNELFRASIFESRIRKMIQKITHKTRRPSNRSRTNYTLGDERKSRFLQYVNGANNANGSVGVLHDESRTVSKDAASVANSDVVSRLSKNLTFCPDTPEKLDIFRVSNSLDPEETPI